MKMRQIVSFFFMIALLKSYINIESLCPYSGAIGFDC